MKNMLYKGDSSFVLDKIKDEIKVDMIYIDPPYNTNRVDMAYEDNRSDEEFLELLKNTFKKSHQMLKETGSIFVSISGKNLHIIRNVLDEVYGKKNYEATMVRVENAKKQKIGRVSLKENYEYVVVYSKNSKEKLFYLIKDERYAKYKKALFTLKNSLKDGEFIKDYIDLKTVEHIDLRMLKLLKSIWEIQENNQGLKQYQYIINNDVYRAADINMYMGRGTSYRMRHPLTHKICKQPKYDFPNISKFSDGWVLSGNILEYQKETIFISNDRIACGNIILGIKEDKIPDYANPLAEDVVPDTLLNITGSDDRALTKLFDGVKVFDYPKPVKLLEYLIEVGSKPGDVVLDFFAGSGTTGVAASNLGRHFILIQRQEPLDTPIQVGSMSFGAVYEITKERLLRSGVNFEVKEDDIQNN